MRIAVNKWSANICI